MLNSIVMMPFCTQNMIIYVQYVVCAQNVYFCVFACIVYFAPLYMSNSVDLCMIKRKWVHASLTRLLLLLVLVVMVAAEGHYVQVA